MKCDHVFCSFVDGNISTEDKNIDQLKQYDAMIAQRV